MLSANLIGIDNLAPESYIKNINLSSGQVQRLGIARSSYRKHEIIIYDEPTSALDNSNKEKLLAFDQVQTEFNQLNKDFTKLLKKKREMQKTLDLGKMINSNQSRSYRSLAQVTRSVPQRVQFTKMAFDGSDSLIIEGVAFSDQDILNFISNLNAKSLIEQASLVDMKILTGDQNSGSSNKKGFVINCKLKVT